MIKVKKQQHGRTCQGDILKDVDHVERVVEANGELEVWKTTFPLVIVLTQDCDLEQDYRVRWGKHRPNDQDKRLISALVAPVYNAEHVFTGQHLSDLGLRMQEFGKKDSSRRNTLCKNQIPRYQYLEFPQSVAMVPCIIDFKHYFSAPLEYLREAKQSRFLCQIGDLFREDISQRFAAFLSRVGLPEVKPRQLPIRT